MRTRARVRVVDYFPADLADFAVACKVSEYDVLSDNDSSDSDAAPDEKRRQWDDGHGWSGRTRWEWRFCLLLEDANAKGAVGDGDTARLQALVADQDAVMLLKMDAEEYGPVPTSSQHPTSQSAYTSAHANQTDRTVCAQTPPPSPPCARSSSSSGATSKSAKQPRLRRCSLEMRIEASALLRATVKRW